MSASFHDQRTRVGYTLACVAALAVATLIGQSFGSSAPQGPRFAAVSGRVTQPGHPGGTQWICFDSGRFHCVYCRLRPDGWFEVKDPSHRSGLVPGRYAVHFFARPKESLALKYQDSATSGLEIEVAPGWNQFLLNLL
jgi:hypothetical protein